MVYPNRPMDERFDIIYNPGLERIALEAAGLVGYKLEGAAEAISRPDDELPPIRLSGKRRLIVDRDVAVSLDEEELRFVIANYLAHMAAVSKLRIVLAVLFAAGAIAHFMAARFPNPIRLLALGAIWMGGAYAYYLAYDRLHLAADIDTFQYIPTYDHALDVIEKLRDAGCQDLYWTYDRWENSWERAARILGMTRDAD